MVLARSGAVIVCMLLLTVVAMPLATSGGATGSVKAAGTPPATPPKPAGDGPYHKGYIDVNIPRKATNPVAARIYYPAQADGNNVATNSSGAPWPTVVFIPGGNGTLGYCNVISSRIASWGFVVVNVELGNMHGQAGYRSVITMAQETSDVIDYIENQTVNVSHPMHGMMDAKRLGVSGHSWGGITSGYSVTKDYGDPRFKASAPISAQPVLGTGTDYIKQVHVPVGLMSGTAEVYQQDEIFKNGNVPITYIRVVGADHGTILNYHEYAVAFFKYWLSGETGYESWVYTDGVLADKAANIVTYDRKLVELAASVTPDGPAEDQAVTLKALASGKIYGTVDYGADWGDLSVSWGPSAANTTTHVYNLSATFDVKVTSEDDYEKDELVVQVTVHNVAPISEAGANVTCIEDEVAHFNGSGSMDTPSDRAHLTYKWDFGDGVAPGPSSAPTAVHAYGKGGTYKVGLTVQDDDKAESTDKLTVTVRNLPPKVEAGKDMVVAEDEEVQFTDGAGNDTPSDLARGLSFSWDFGDRNATGPSGSPLSSHVYERAGNYTATLSASDDDRAVGNDTVKVSVRNSGPTVIITVPETGASFPKDEPVEFAGMGTDTRTDALSLVYRWNFGDGNVTEWGPGAAAVHTYTKGGDYPVALRVRDDNGAEGETAITMTVENAPPVCSIVMPLKGASFDEDMVVTFSASAEDTPSDQGHISFAWDLGDGAFANGSTVKHAYAAQGDYTIKLRATDPEGAGDGAEIVIKVSNVPPKADAMLSRRSVKAGETVDFSGSGTDTPSDRSSLALAWDFGDGTTPVTNPNGTHTFKAAGTYNVVFTVTDNDMRKATASFTVTVAKNESGGGGGGGGPKGTLNGNMALAIGGGVVAAIVAVVAVLLLVRRRKGRSDN
jgi:PKD repeat protein/dienelactone hydrolase